MGFWNNLFGNKSAQQKHNSRDYYPDKVHPSHKVQSPTRKKEGIELFLGDLALLMGYSEHETHNPQVANIVAEMGWKVIIILSPPEHPAKFKETMVSNLIWGISKRPELNNEFIKEVMKMHQQNLLPVAK